MFSVLWQYDGNTNRLRAFTDNAVGRIIRSSGEREIRVKMDKDIEVANGLFTPSSLSVSDIEVHGSHSADELIPITSAEQVVDVDLQIDVEPFANGLIGKNVTVELGFDMDSNGEFNTDINRFKVDFDVSSLLSGAVFIGVRRALSNLNQSRLIATVAGTVTRQVTQGAKVHARLAYWWKKPPRDTGDTFAITFSAEINMPYFIQRLFTKSTLHSGLDLTEWELYDCPDKTG